MKVKVRFEFLDDYSDDHEFMFHAEMCGFFEEFGLEELVDEWACDDGNWYEYNYEGKLAYS
jgi:hypothetical protein